MKKIISILLLLAAVFSLAACNNEPEASYGVVEADGKVYFVADGGAIVIDGGKATAADASAVSGTPASKKLAAPDTTEDYFVYSEINGKINITGLTDSGKAQSVIVLPEKIGGKAVAMVSAGAFDGLKSLVIAETDAAITLADNALKGVTNVYLATKPDLVGVGENLLSDSNGVNLYVCADEFSNFKSHYNWGNHSAKLNKF